MRSASCELRTKGLSSDPDPGWNNEGQAFSCRSPFSAERSQSLKGNGAGDALRFPPKKHSYYHVPQCLQRGTKMSPQEYQGSGSSGALDLSNAEALAGKRPSRAVWW